ncbi:MAG: hypothetical protein QM811_01265 [Pirellulales bacterium]
MSNENPYQPPQTAYRVSTGERSRRPIRRWERLFWMSGVIVCVTFAVLMFFQAFVPPPYESPPLGGQDQTPRYDAYRRRAPWFIACGSIAMVFAVGCGTTLWLRERRSASEQSGKNDVIH